jgi:dolichol-phosphate mannosyltransferase
MTAQRPLVSIIIPAYREQANIYKTIDDIVRQHDALDYSYEVVVVVDGSPDDTAKEARRHASKHVRVLSYEKNQGKGYALKYGVAEAHGEIITFADAGGDFDPKQFDRCIKLLQAFDADFVIGSKWHPASRVTTPPLRRIFSRGFHTLFKLLFRLPITDTQTGLKFMKANVAKDVMPRLLVKQYAFDVEMLVVAHQLGYTRIFEAPVDLVMNTNVSSISFKAIRRMFNDVLAVFYRAHILNYYRKQDS